MKNTQELIKEYSKLTAELRKAFDNEDEDDIAMIKARRAEIREQLPKTTEVAYGLMA